MLSNLFKKNINKISFEDMLVVIKDKNKYLLINTLPLHEQDILLENTVHHAKEEEIINNMISNYDMDKKHIVVYGKNSNDNSSEEKYNQLIKLGFKYVYLYIGGLFEWLLLQDIYGKDEFSTTNYTRDILKFKPKQYITV